MEDGHKRHLKRYLLIAVGVSVGAIVLISFWTMDKKTFKAVARIDVFSFALVLALVIGKWVSECARYQLILRAMGRRLPFRNTSKAVLGGAFSGAVTPYRTATIPVQILFFTRYGLTGGEATAVATTGAALSILLLTISLPIILILSASKIHVGFGIRSLLVMAAIIGFFVFVFAMYSMRDPNRFSRAMTKLTPARYRSRPGFVEFRDRLAGVMEDFSASLQRLLKAPRRLLGAIVGLSVIFWVSQAFVGALILRGLGYPQYFWKAVLAQIVVESILPFTPVPGESGVAEGTFAAVFGLIIQKNILAVVTLAWRFFMFYLPLVGLGTAFVLATRDASTLPSEEERNVAARTELERTIFEGPAGRQMDRPAHEAAYSSYRPSPID